MIRLLAAAALAATLPMGAFAFDDADRQAVSEAARDYGRDFIAKDFEGLASALPPTLRAYMADQLGASPDEVIGTMAEQMSVFLADTTVDKFTMDTSRMKTGETSNGIAYAFIPTASTVTGEGNTVSKDAQTLAIEEGGSWYFLRIEQPQQYEIVKAVFPGFERVRLPR
ncbi:MAG: hypothetical protein ACU0CY_00640 [Maritimibacter harenae]|jgi:hypothetical protein|uniref:Uncharacterized protein n=1 Tax=Maritimibacter harenae TaxID=2606218 RepID=A0A845LYF1_9RHOB|nr:hypothetical protein [Maritimibacter harenae]MZR11809.1 hypothetical protein [Maritimibacter harenae]